MTRVARVTALTLQSSQEAAADNVFTLIRHRRAETLGPWAAEPDECWHRVDIGDGLTLWRSDMAHDRCRALVAGIVESATLAIDDVEIRYALSETPRRHRASNVYPEPSDVSMVTPFAHHSAEITEYWYLADAIPSWWPAKLDDPPAPLKTVLADLGFPLDKHPERAGNLMVAAAEDEVTCRLTYKRQDKSLRLEVSVAQELVPGAYRATVWAHDSGDEVLRRAVEVTECQTVIPVGTLVSRIGYELYRTEDGRCIDASDVPIARELYFNATMKGPTLDFRGPKDRSLQKVSLDSRTTIKVPSSEGGESVDEQIRQLWRRGQAHQREVAARKEGKLVRFDDDEIDQADTHFISLLSHHGDDDVPIYLADPYFVDTLRRSHRTREAQLLIRMFAATAPRPLRILCGKPAPDGAPLSWRSRFLATLTNHVHIRSFQSSRGEDRKPAFHDRYLITPEREVSISHSINGWGTDGVTFFAHPYEVYGSEGEQLWSLGTGALPDGRVVEDIK